MKARTNTIAAGILGVAAVATMPMVANAALDPSDTSIISLYHFNDQVGATPFNNSVKPQFIDTAVTGTPQNHDDLGAASPTWINTPGIGDGKGIDLDKANTQFTRFTSFMNTSQGNYSDGKSFTAMVRLNLGDTVDNQVQDIIGIGSHGISLQGNSTPGTASVNIRVRDQNTFWTLDNSGTTNGAGSTGSSFVMNSGVWTNLFLIYNANTSLTLAFDNGTTFAAQTANGAPSGFDTLTELFDNAGVPWYVGSTGAGVNTLDGQIETIAIWDKALSLSEADAIGLTNVPEPASLGLLGVVMMAGVRCRK
jgi:hypothetical protein